MGKDPPPAPQMHPQPPRAAPGWEWLLGKDGQEKRAGGERGRRDGHSQISKQQELSPAGLSQNFGDHRVCISFFQERKSQAKI